MELVWEDPPVPEAPFFTRDHYDKYSLAPTVRELWAFLQSPVENANVTKEHDAGAGKVSCSTTTEEAKEFEDDSCISKEESCWDSCDSDGLVADSGAEDCKDTKKTKADLKQLKNEADAAYPEPRLPYPCMSSLSSKEQKMYLAFLLKSKKTREPPQSLMERVNNEVMQFMRYLQDVSRICADDYSFISQGAMQYSEDLFKCCLECIKAFPQLYQIHEMTSLTGGTFNPGLTLTFEKQLLIMGNVDITDHKIVPADAQLASDYQSVSSENPPAKKAKDMHAAISSDSNAEKLCARYEPHVCLTQDALVRLLDNHGPDFADQWELPVWVKLSTEKGMNLNPHILNIDSTSLPYKNMFKYTKDVLGSSQKKTVYIDSPLLKTEMTVRERSHVFHEESLKLSLKKNNRTNVFHLMTELPVNEQQLSPENSQRNVASFEKSGLDFDVDLTDLETFGETTPLKTPKMQKMKMQNEQDACVKSEKVTGPSPLCKTKKSSEHLVNTSSSSQETSASLTNNDYPITEETTQLLVSEAHVAMTEQLTQDSAQESDGNQTVTGDSDDERLVIDDSLSPAATPTTQHKPKPTPCSAEHPPTPASVNSASSSPQKVTKRRQTKRAKVADDQLGEILRMQTAMFNSANDASKGSSKSQETNSPTKSTSVHSHPTSLVKPCVSSYLERNHNQDEETCVAPVHGSAQVVHTKGQKKILSQDLQAGAEDEQDYKAPEKGNLLYKIYSLQDLLLMVRSSVSLTHSRKVVGIQSNKYVPVHVLPKLEYQLSYGVECLSSHEACQLWTETALHSSTVSYIAHINAHTSKVAQLRKLPDDWKQKISCGFKPSKSLNILHHLLKKLTRLEEGQYLIAHKAKEPFVTFLKTVNGKVSRGLYDLEQVHSTVPQPPVSGFVPWIPVDPAVVLPFHQKHGRVPCTFPPKPFLKTSNDGTSQSNNLGAGQSNKNLNAGGKKKKRKLSKRSAKRNKYIKKLVQKSV